MRCKLGYEPCIRCNGGKSNSHGIDQSRVGEFRQRDWRGDESELNSLLEQRGQKQNSHNRKELRKHLA